MIKLFFKQFVISLFGIIVLFLLLQCGHQKPTFTKSRESYLHKLDRQFEQAYNTYRLQNYQLARTLFESYLQVDTTGVNYESVAFLADTYKHLGDVNAGRAVYNENIEHLGKILTLNERMMSELEYWASIYPQLPAELDSHFNLTARELPEIVGGYDALRENIEYPRFLKNPNTIGTVVMQALIDTSGEATQFRIYHSPGVPFDSAAVNAVRRTDFEPGKKFGRKYPYWYYLPISFNKPTVNAFF